MGLRQLEYFVAVAEEGSFTRGARRVRVAQSGFPPRFRSWSGNWACRSSPGRPPASRSPTPGTALLPEARGLLSAERRARDTVDQVRGGLRGTIRMGTLTSIGNRPESRGRMVLDLLQVLGRFHVTHPLVTFQLRTAPRGSAGHLASILAGELDLAMVGTNDRPDGIHLHRLGSIRQHFVCAKRHRFAEVTSVSLADLADERFIDSPAAGATAP